MNCAEFEISLADYLDGTLEPAARSAFEQHAAGCAGCRQLWNEVRGAVEFLRRADEIAPPPELITRIAYLVPIGRTREAFERQGYFSRLATKWLQPLLQPRLAMGMAMTILSFAMLERCTGVKVQHIAAADLDPARIWGGTENRVIRVKDRAVKYYENLRWVYEIETQLKSLEDQQEAFDSRDNASGKRAVQTEPGKRTTSEGNKK